MNLVKLYAGFWAAGFLHLCMFQSITWERALRSYPIYFNPQKQLFARTVLDGGVAILSYVNHLASQGLQPNTDFLEVVVTSSKALKMTLREEEA